MNNGFPYKSQALLMAPLSGYTDLPYRRAARRCGCQYAFTEMVDAASLTYARKRSEGMLLRGSEEDFLGLQLVGANHDFLRCAADVANEYDFSLLDFNLGCPVPKVAKKGAGAELGRNIDEALRCFEILKQYSRFPLTAKIRILSADDPAPTLRLCQGLAELGAKAITIHGLIKEVFYSGPVNCGFIRMVREALPHVQIIANGGVTGLASYRKMVRETGCDAVMLARGAMGNPWLFKELQEGDAFVPPDLDELFDVMHQHVLGMVQLYGEEGAMRIARKVVYDYIRGRGFHSNVKAAVSALSTLADFNDFLKLARASHAESYFRQQEQTPMDRRLRQ